MSPITFALAQSTTRWHDPAGNREAFAAKLGDLSRPCDVLVLPEMFSTGFTMDSKALAEPMDGITVSWMKAQSRALGSVVCGSLIIEDGGYFNRLIWATPDGEIQHYDKRHLFRMADEHEFFDAGSERVTVSYKDWRICLSVCYDLRFPVWLRNQDDYDLLLCIANWPAARALAWQTLLRARAIENQSYCVGVNIVGTDGNGLSYAGDSGVYEPDGEMLVAAGQEEVVTFATLEPSVLTSLRQAFPVGLDADRFELERG